MLPRRRNGSAATPRPYSDCRLVASRQKQRLSMVRLRAPHQTLWRAETGLHLRGVSFDRPSHPRIRLAEAIGLLLTVRAPFVTEIERNGSRTVLNFDNCPLHLFTPAGR